MDESNLTQNGKTFLLYARTIHGETLETIDASIDADGYYDDFTFPIVRVVSKITVSQRMRKFGLETLSLSDMSGKLSPQGYPIPTEDYIGWVVNSYGDEPDSSQVTLEPYWGKLKREKITAEGAINKAGDDLAKLLSEGEYDILPAQKFNLNSQEADDLVASASESRNKRRVQI